MQNLKFQTRQNESCEHVRCRVGTRYIHNAKQLSIHPFFHGPELSTSLKGLAADFYMVKGRKERKGKPFFFFLLVLILACCSLSSDSPFHHRSLCLATPDAMGVVKLLVSSLLSSGKQRVELVLMVDMVLILLLLLGTSIP